MVIGRYLSGFDAQETCHWRQEEGMEEEAKVSGLYCFYLNVMLQEIQNSRCKLIWYEFSW